MKITQVFISGKRIPFNHEYKTKEEAQRAIDFTKTRGEIWMLESEVENFGTEPVSGKPCGTGWF